MNSLTGRQLEVHVPVVAWLLIASHALFALIGGFLCVLLTGIGVAVREAEATPILTVVGLAMAGLFVVLAIPGLAAGLGLLARKSWGRILAIVVAVLNLVNFPIGTVVGLYVLWVLLQDAAAGYFAPAGQPGGATQGE